jgi:UDP-N-acetylmuramoylalanine--D-glutamate ligase
VNKETVPHKNVSVLGAGRSGLAVARLLLKKGASVFVSEEKSKREKEDVSVLFHSLNIPVEFGGHSEKVLDSDWLVVSPGVDLSIPVIRRAEDKGLPVYSELEVASWFCPSSIIAVTGSNGKSTTSALLGEIFRQAKIPCCVAGNIGEPFSDHVLNMDPQGVAVVEVSSFQLERIDTFHPNVCIYLNLTPDHLDRHGSMKFYGEIKARIFKNQDPEDILIYNSGDEHVVHWVHQAVSRKIPFNIIDETCEGGFVRDDVLILKLEDIEETLIPIHAMRLSGMHNVMNGLAAALAARSLGVKIEPIRNTLKNFEGLPHRLEFVRELNGVQYINDSKATNIFSVWFALGAFSQPVILIAGGHDKDSDFSQLHKRIQEKVKMLILIGEAAKKMADAFQDVPSVTMNSLEEAVCEAHRIAVFGDVVLLSPACASFDMFRDFNDRGDRFKNLVRAL